MPKIELHLHLEGAIPYKALFELVQKYGGDGEIKSPEDIVKKFVFRDFNHFLKLWTWKNKFIREYEDFSFIANSVAADLKSQNVKYAEMFVSASDFKDLGLSCSKIIEAVAKGISSVSGIKISIIVDMVRDKGPVNALRTLSEIEEVKGMGIIGIGLGGSEHEFPPELFCEVFESARNKGFKTTVHSGEACGAASVKTAVEKLRPDRIGHAVGAASDENLLKDIARLKIPVELCPISNVKTGVVKSEEVYPFEKFVKCGVEFSINTDDPKMFGNCLAEEYFLIENKLGYSRMQIIEFVLNSVNTSWLTFDEKKSLRDELKKECMFFLKK